MKRNLGKQAEQYRSSNKRKKLGYRVLWCLGAVVVFCTTYALILPAITMENEYLCGMEAHEHDESCWVHEVVEDQPQLICGEDYADADILLHVHDDFCYDQEGDLTCELEEVENHIHDEACYQEMRTLICPEEGIELENEPEEPEEAPVELEYHQHDDSCYQESEPYLICTLEENEEHTHDEQCYQSDLELACELEEIQPDTELDAESDSDPLEGVHVHNDECYEITQELFCEEESYLLHVHEEDCYDEDGNLICALPVVLEHQHGDSCVIYSEPREVIVYGCGKEPHIHDDSCYVELRPAPSPCGLAEHMHDLEHCYFPDGGLKCTMPEHLHDETCQEPWEPENPEEVENLSPLDPYMEIHTVQLADQYSCDVGGFLATFQVEGPATWTEMVEPSQNNDGESQTEDDWTDSAGQSGALPSENAEDWNFDQENEWTEDPQSGQNDLSDEWMDGPSEPEDLTDSTEQGVFNAPEGLTDPQEQTVPMENGELFDGNIYQDADNQFAGIEQDDQWPVEDVQYQVDILEEGDEAYENFLAQSGENDSEESLLMMQVLSFTALLDGQELDLSQCKIEVTFTPTQELLDVLESAESDQSVMAIDSLNEYFSDAEVKELPTEDGFIPAEGQNGGTMLEDVGTDGAVDLFAGQENSTADEVEPVYTMAVMNVSGQRSAAEVNPHNQISAVAEDGVVGVEVSKQANPEFIVQYYAYLNTVDTNKDGKEGMSELPVINTERDGQGNGGILPTNGSGKENIPAGTSERNLYIDANGNVQTTGGDAVQPIYRSHKFEYTKAPGLQYVNIVADQSDTEYTLDGIWVLREGRDAASINPEDWTVYPYKDGMRITNRKQTADEDPNGMYVYIADQSVIRLVYKTHVSSAFYSAKFYDYDISDGNHSVVNHVTTMNTKQQGINNGGNYDGIGAKYAFGNSNTGTKLDSETWNGYKINMRNDQSYKLCAFGLVTGARFDENGKPSNPIFADNVVAPNLFDGTATGKYYVNKLTGLNFIREGDTYTLTSVAGAPNVQNLHQFKNPQAKYTHIWTNNFWPMDGIDTGAKDVSFGTEANKQNRKFGPGDWDTLPIADDDKDHNSFFGMTFAIDFELTSDYIGPLEYYFFGDDDMWVILSDENGQNQQLICDIGGVHPSVGEYVNLWDYIKKDESVNPSTEDATKTKYRLSFFYTERGASGSTCWMQFTLPTVVGVDLEHEIEEKVDANNGALTIGKDVQGNETTQEFHFTLELEGADDNYTMTTKRKTNSGEWEDVEIIAKGTTEFYLRHDERLYIAQLPKGTTYKITELIDQSPGYSPSHVTTITNRDANGDGVADAETKVDVGDPVLGNVAEGRIEGFTAVKVIYTNHTSYVLPETGGEGLFWYYTVGSGMLLAAGYQLSRHKKTRREGAEE